MLGFFWALIVGFIIGAIAKFIMPGRDPGGFIITILLGVCGAELATFLGRAVGWYRGDQTARFVGSVVGAIIILAAYRFYLSRRGPVGGPAGGRRLT
jgi:uncharacterized membrane protein YeaQ/YmgE (transglycosylase-associated protein family)